MAHTDLHQVEEHAVLHERNLSAKGIGNTRTMRTKALAYVPRPVRPNGQIMG